MKKAGIIILIVVLVIIFMTLGNILKYAIKEGGNMFDFSEIERIPENIRKEKTISIEGIDKIELEFVSSKINVILTEDSQLRVIEYSNKELEDNTLEVVQGSNSIKVKEKMNRKWWFFNNQNRNYDVFLPKKYEKDITITDVSGNIYISGELTVENLKIKATSADVIIENKVKADEVEVSSVSGKITLAEVESKSLKAKSTSGEIEIEDAQNKVEAESISGNIKIQKLAGRLEAKTTSGEIFINLFKVEEESKLQSISGNIKVKFDKESNCVMKTKTTSGRVDFPNGRNTIGAEPYYTVDLKTTSGNIRLAMQE